MNIKELAVGDLLQPTTANRLVEELTKGDYTPLDDAESPPWLEAGVIVEVDPHIWRSYFEDSDTTTVTDEAGDLYFLIRDASVGPRLCWQRGELCLARKLSVAEARALARDDPRPRRRTTR